MDMHQVLKNTVQKFPNKTFIIFKNKEFTYSHFYDQVTKLISGLSDLGIKKGDRVSIFLGNQMEFIFTYFATLALGAIFVPINASYKENELNHILTDVKPKIIITTNRQIQNIISKLVFKPEFISSIDQSSNKEVIDFKKLFINKKIFLDENNDKDIATIIYTSGTTGKAKGSMLMHINFLSNAEALVTSWKWTATDRILLSIPIFHQHGLGVVLNGTVYIGSSIVMLERFNQHDVLNNISKYRCNVFMGVPTMYQRLLNIDNPKSYDLNHMRLFVSGSGPLSEKTFYDFKDKFGFEILERYGLTETIMNTSNPYDHRKPGTVGKPLPGINVKINISYDQNDTKKTGEILIKGPNVMKGYWGKKSDTKKVLVDGWFHTGDIGYFDDESMLHIVGRKREMINTAGFKVYPREVEELLENHPNISEVAILGIEDIDKGEIVKAYIVKEKNKAITEKQIIEYCKDKISSFKIPKEIVFISHMPRTASGKMVKSALK